jgi:hypothetical protein
MRFPQCNDLAEWSNEQLTQSLCLEILAKEDLRKQLAFPALLRKSLTFNGSAYGNRTRLTGIVVLSGW